jgi:hypothetical protein
MVTSLGESSSSVETTTCPRRTHRGTIETALDQRERPARNEDVQVTVSRLLWKKRARVDGFIEGLSIFGSTDEDLAYFVNGKQVVNEIHGELELRLTRKIISARRSELKVDPRVELRGSSDWLTVRTSKTADDVFVLGLARLAAEAHRPGHAEIVRPPPTGADLARRRRFH